jgi:hypothetical protein
MTDNFAGQVHNSLIHDFSGAAITVGAGALGLNGAPNPRFFNNTWGTFGGGAGSLDTIATAADGNTSIGVDPLLIGISRINNGMLDPRPNLTSPLFTSSLSAFPADAPAGFFNRVNYRGAFGGSNWLNSWSYLDRCGYLSGLPDVGGEAGTGGVGMPPFADADSDGISDSLESSPALQSLGFTVGANNAALFTSLFTSTSIQDLSANDIIVQKSGNTATLNIPVERSTNLQSPFTPAGNATLVIPNVPANKEFYRFRVAP